MTNKEMLKLPQRKWDAVTVYDTITLVDTGRKHDSGFALIAIIGYKEGQDASQGEIAAFCDDVSFDLPPTCNNPMRSFACDMKYRSGRTHFHSWYHRFEVGLSLSSTTIKIIPRKVS